MRQRRCNQCFQWTPVSDWASGCPHCGYTNNGEKLDYRVMHDITPFTSMIDGSRITSRWKKDAHYRAHNVVEIGNDSSLKNPKYRAPESPPGVKNTLVDSLHIVKDEYRRKGKGF